MVNSMTGSSILNISNLRRRMMKRIPILTCLVQTLTFGRIASLALAVTMLYPLTLNAAGIQLARIGTYSSGIYFDGGPVNTVGSGAGIAAYDPKSQRLFVVNVYSHSIDVLDMHVPTVPALLFSIDVSPYGSPNSVDVKNGVVAVAVAAVPKTDHGMAVFFDTKGKFLNAVEAGALPDMITFTPDGERVLVANEGEPSDDYAIDPEGSVTIIELEKGAANISRSDVITAGFREFNSATLDASIRIFGPKATVAQDLEPEYITVSSDSKTAWVTLQENNAIGVLDVRHGVFTKLIGLGFKDHSGEGDGFDASDRDGKNNIANWQHVRGMYQPDAIAAYQVGDGNTYLVMANEGDSRDYPGFSELARVGSLPLDPVAFPDAEILKSNAYLGRLRVTNANGDTDGDGDYDELFAFGGRSFSIWKASGTFVFDSRDDFEQKTAELRPANFNANNTNNIRDDRSDDKGPEPEGVAVGKAFGRTYAFIGLERIGGIMVYDVSDPFHPQFVQYENDRNFSADPASGTAGDLGPEGLAFIREQDSPNGKPLLVVSNEVSGTTTIYKISESD
jgi:hypothetical protein